MIYCFRCNHLLTIGQRGKKLPTNGITKRRLACGSCGASYEITIVLLKDTAFIGDELKSRTQHVVKTRSCTCGTILEIGSEAEAKHKCPAQAVEEN